MYDAIFALNKIDTLESVSLETEHPGSHDDAQLSDEEPLANFCKIRPRGSSKLSLRLSNLRVTVSMVRALFDKSSRLTALTLSGIEHLNDYVDDMAQDLRKNQSLEKLVLDGHYLLRFDPAITVLEALEENIALQNLRLEFKIDESPLSIASANTMAASIQKFGTLKELNLICDDRRDEEKFDIVAAVLQGLAENTSLTVAKFRQRRPISCDKARESLIQICCHTEIEKLGLSLEGNTDFKNLALWVGDQSISLGAKIEFWLKVNQSGARELGSQPCNRKLWVDMLIENKESPMLSFYVFLSNPHLFFQQAEKGPEKRADLQPKSHKLRKLSHP